MKTTCALALAWMVLASPAPAANSTHPYQRIPLRNVFNLLPVQPPPPNEPPRPVRPPPPKIFITGLVEIEGVSKALVEVSEPGKPVHRHILAAGNGLDRFQVLAVDVPAGQVRVLLDGNEETLTLQTPKSPPAGPPPLPGPPPPRLALPGRG